MPGMATLNRAKTIKNKPLLNMTCTNTRIPIHITAHNLSLSPPLYKFVHKKIGTVTRIAMDVLAIEIVLRRNPSPRSERFSVSARLALPGRDVHSHVSSPDLYVAVGIVAARLARRLRKRKTRIAKTCNGRSALRNAGTGFRAPVSPVLRKTSREGSERRLSGVRERGTAPVEPRVFVFRRKAPSSFLLRAFP
ncbi:ribosome hibernation-promoting factor, HPF/YfiA family [Verrucomicrobiota bacterium sgz303538]